MSNRDLTVKIPENATVEMTENIKSTLDRFDRELTERGITEHIEMIEEFRRTRKMVDFMDICNFRDSKVVGTRS